MSLGYVTAVEQNMAKAQGTNLPISLKHAIEICNYIRGKPLAAAKKILESVIALDAPIPFKRFTDGVGHRKGNLTSGRFPVKACSELLRLLSSAESNALYKGMNTKDLFIAAIVPKQAPGEWRHGRQRRRKMKRAHVEVILQERTSGKRVPEQQPSNAVANTTTAQQSAPKPATQPNQSEGGKVSDVASNISKPTQEKSKNPSATPNEKTKQVQVEGQAEKKEQTNNNSSDKKDGEAKSASSSAKSTGATQ